jgi:hypothetical protein
MNRIRPRFSVRTLAIFVTLVCVYFGAWEVTKKYGVERTPGVTKTKHSAIISVSADSVPPETITVASESPAPFIVSRCLYHFEYVAKSQQAKQYSVVNGPVHYYVWLFGAQFKLPFESTW